MEHLDSEPYEPRRTWSLGVHGVAQRQLKAYAITRSGADLTAGLLDAALAHAARCLPAPAPAEPPYGFLSVHAGEEAAWLLVDTWLGDILELRLFRGALGAATFESAPFEGSAVCVWELEVVKHERDAWVRHVLAQPGDPQWTAYLDDRLTIDGG